MVGCTQGMLLCLDREHRMAYVLGDVLQFTSEDAAPVVQRHAGDLPQAAPARPLAPADLHAGTLRRSWTPRTPAAVTAASAQRSPMVAQTRSNLLFATRVEGLKRDMEAFTDAGAIFRSHPELRANSRIVDAVLRAIA